MTQLCDLDPMLDDIKILARCISIWKSHPGEKTNEVWSLNIVLQDPHFAKLLDETDSMGHVVMILQLAKVKYFNEKPSLSNAMYSTKVYINDGILKIAAFKQRWHQEDGYLKGGSGNSRGKRLAISMVVEAWFSEKEEM
ncbi:replication protein A 70 kDa DNA-binding subunit B [Tanacetum coccineum]